jgi:MoxR-like ATPase
MSQFPTATTLRSAAILSAHVRVGNVRHDITCRDAETVFPTLTGVTPPFPKKSSMGAVLALMRELLKHTPEDALKYAWTACCDHTDPTHIRRWIWAAQTTHFTGAIAGQITSPWGADLPWDPVRYDTMGMDASGAMIFARIMDAHAPMPPAPTAPPGATVVQAATPLTPQPAVPSLAGSLGQPITGPVTPLPLPPTSVTMQPGAQITGMASAMQQAMDALRAAEALTQKHHETVEALDAANKRIQELEARPQYQPAAPCQQVPAGQPTVPLDIVARACSVTVDTVQRWLDGARRAWATPPGVVSWPAWANPADKTCELALAWADCEPVLATGPSGSGKTHALREWCLHKHGAVCVFSMHADLTYTRLIGGLEVGGGETFFRLGEIALAVLAGVPVLTDEIDHARLDIQSVCHGFMDKRALDIPQIGLRIPLATEFPPLLATANSLTDDTGKYHGELATALVNRFARSVFVEYADADAEALMVHAQCPTADASTIITIVGIVRSLRASEAKDGRVTGPFSLRQAVQATKYYMSATAAGMPSTMALSRACRTVWGAKRPPAEQLAMQEIIAQTAGVDFLAGIGGGVP